MLSRGEIMMTAAEDHEVAVPNFPTPSVIVVDDNIDELYQLREGLDAAQIPCLAVHYKDDFHQQFTSPFVGVRVLFLDIGLWPGGMDITEPQQIAGVLAGVIESLVSPGPWILIFWTQHAAQAATIMEVLEDRERFPNFPLPLTYEVMDKEVVKRAAEGNGDERDAAEREKVIQEVKERMSQILSDCPFSAIFEWEGRIAQAASDTLNVVLSLARNEKETQPLPELCKDYGAVMAEIAKQAVGKEVVEKPSQAAERGLFPLIMDRIMSLPRKPEYNLAWSATLAGCGREEPGRLAAMPDHVKPEILNKHYLLEERDDFARDQRGVWLEVNEIAGGNVFGELFNYTKKQTLAEFLNFQGRKFDNPTKKGLRERCKVGLLECSAECDHAWKKLSILRYVICVLVPKDLEIFTQYPTFNQHAHEGIFQLPEAVIAGEICFITFNFRLSVGLAPDSTYLGRPLFRLRRDAANDISFRCSQHWARPGFLSFKSE
jgi:hypothetical protein